MSSLSSLNDKVTPQMKKIMDQQEQDYNEIKGAQRFGFFSIIPNPVIGDRYYSLNKNFNHKVVERKIITEKRGIFTTPGKTGKGHDAYFASLDTTDQGVQERLQKGWEEDNKKHLQKVQEFKKRPVTAVFKYPGVQHYKNLYDQNPVERNFPIYKNPPLHHKVVEGKVIIENRGIYTQPMKKGFNNTPGIYFSYATLREDLEAKDLKNMPERNKIKRAQSAAPSKKGYQRAFMPASLKKNECFSNIHQTYGYEDDYFNKLKDYSEKVRKTNGPRFKKNLPKGSVTHQRPFTPSHLGKQGREGLFDQRIWDCPQIPEEKKIINQRARVEYENKHRKTPYYYNRLQDASRFSPPIITNQMNMRKTFPTFFRK